MKKIIKQNIDSLPSLPTNIIELEDFRKTDSYDAQKLLKIIEKDPLMVATILKVANSSMFGFRGGVETLSRAINLLGINFTISVAIGSSIQNIMASNLCAYASTNEDFIFASSLATNIVNTWISSIDFDLKNELLLPAFLQEVGKYVISETIQANRLTEEFLQEMQKSKDLAKSEEDFIGYSCAKITANIFKHWSFNHNIIFSIAFVGKLEDCPEEYKQKAQILEIVKILCDIRSPLNDDNIQLAIEKAAIYGFDVEHLVNSIDVIKEVIEQNS
jgi:HD-like signal output (HDOD) protein